MMITTNRFIAYEILMVEKLFKFFEFEVLRSEFCGGFVAIGRRTHPTPHNPPKTQTPPPQHTTSYDSSTRDYQNIPIQQRDFNQPEVLVLYYNKLPYAEEDRSLD